MNSGSQSLPLRDLKLSILRLNSLCTASHSAISPAGLQKVNILWSFGHGLLNDLWFEITSLLHTNITSLNLSQWFNMGMNMGANMKVFELGGIGIAMR